MKKTRSQVVSDFRKSFRKHFYFDITGFVIPFVFMVVSVFLVPLVSVFFNIDMYYLMIIMQSSNLIFVAWVWNEINVMNKKNKEL